MRDASDSNPAATNEAQPGDVIPGDVIPVFVNAGSGAQPEPRDAQARDAFAALGRRADVTVLEDCSKLDAQVQDALRMRPQVLVAGGGDGTVAAIAAQLVHGERVDGQRLNGDTALGVLPLGTLNHFAKDIGIPAELDDAARVIVDGHRICVDSAQLNERVFLNNSSLGLYPRIVSEREDHQKRLHLGKWPALARATWHALRDPRSFTLRLCVDGETIERRTPFVFVGNNRYQLQGFAAGSRPRLDEGVLSLYVLRPQTLFGFVRIAVRALFGRVRGDEDFEAFTATELEVMSARDTVEVALDGEVTTMRTPLRYRIRPRSLQVMAPVAEQKPAEQETGAQEA